MCADSARYCQKRQWLVELVSTALVPQRSGFDQRPRRLLDEPRIAVGTGGNLRDDCGRQSFAGDAFGKRRTVQRLFLPSLRGQVGRRAIVRVRQRQQLADERRLLAAGSALREQSPELF
jgi:hypothetical protein